MNFYFNSLMLDLNESTYKQNLFEIAIYFIIWSLFAIIFIDHRFKLTNFNNLFLIYKDCLSWFNWTVSHFVSIFLKHFKFGQAQP